MLNQIVLVGKIKSIDEVDNKKELLLEVDRPFNENEGRKSDIFICKLWNCLFNRMLSLCACGDLVAIRGRVNYENEIFVVNTENIVLLNKSKENVLKI